MCIRDSHRTENDALKNLLKDLKANKIENDNPYKITLKLAQKIFKSFEDENDILLDLSLIHI